MNVVKSYKKVNNKKSFIIYSIKKIKILSNLLFIINKIHISR